MAIVYSDGAFWEFPEIENYYSLKEFHNWVFEYVYGLVGSRYSYFYFETDKVYIEWNGFPNYFIYDGGTNEDDMIDDISPDFMYENTESFDIPKNRDWLLDKRPSSIWRNVEDSWKNVLKRKKEKLNS